MTPLRESDLAARLRAAGLRVTAPRLAVLTALADAPHSTADDVAGHVREALGSVSTQAIYDVLRACVSAGLVRRIEPAGSSARYETRIGDNHHHLVCRGCGRVADVDCVVGAAPCLHPAGVEDGFTVDEAEVVFWGTCADCRAQQQVSFHHITHQDEESAE
ncbi:Fur family transcriptional regulator [Mycolicibacterium litorale]|uniref:Transcriptional repressor n=1 Tax=Mycolicibacterium litorale TaxID=758802 RepID=A0AAD1IWJ7_9MYCO|nr:Fur family transcriptional regulator [Mycolicibacterium litorale]MCV7417878.1 transcriptional repressor [Mycolicibacterium litorale]TDY06734.1 Fur family ferric uptake transcriptional regulator [Mycolicibacterium litorale]BBY19113.1 transcriptional repressor [Mycolicibacterium litorale]